MSSEFALIPDLQGGVWHLLVQDGRPVNPVFHGTDVKTRFPGGGSEPDDSNRAETIYREVEEETGLVRLEWSTGPEIIHEFNDDGEQKGFHLLPFETLGGRIRKDTLIDDDTVLEPPR